MSKRVNKEAIFKMFEKVGLTPIKESFTIEKQNYYDKYSGSYTDYDYRMKTKEGVWLSGDKSSGIDVSFRIVNNSIKYHENVEELLNLMNDYGYETDTTINVSSECKNEITRNISELYQEEIDEILSIIKMRIKVDTKVEKVKKL